MDLTDKSKEPSSALVRICDLIDDCIAQFLVKRSALLVSEFEADIEAISIFNLSIRHVEALLQIARTDRSLVPAAYTLARAAFECAVRACWLVDDDDPFKREVRYIAHLDGDISALRRSAERTELTDSVGERVSRADQIEQFRNGVGSALEERGYALLKKPPNFAAMLNSVGGDRLYSIYIQTSQYAHGGHQATWLYRSGGLGTYRQSIESLSEGHWILPLRMCWLALSTPGDILLRRISNGAISGWSDELQEVVDAIFRDFAGGQSQTVN